MLCEQAECSAVQAEAETPGRVPEEQGGAWLAALKECMSPIWNRGPHI